MKINYFILCILILVLPSFSYAEFSLITFLEKKKFVNFCDDKINFDDQHVKERFEKEFFLAFCDKAQVLLWLKRSSRYFPVIEQILRENNLPDDLKYVAVIESALRPDIRSVKKAVGIWQFIPSTADAYGLKINSSIDERRDIIKATEAASRYFKDLYAKFNNWELALAAYNIGEMRVQDELKSQNTKSFYDLWLPEETMRYIFKVFAAKMIFENRKELGFYLDKKDYYPQYKLDKILFTSTHAVPVQLACNALNISFYEFKMINPAIIGDYFIIGENTFYFEKLTDKDKVVSIFNEYKKKWVDSHSQVYYKVEKGDSLIRIAEKFSVRIKDILEWNQLDYEDYIYPKQRLVIKTSMANLK